MKNDRGKALVRQVSLLAVALTAVVAAPAGLLGGAGVLWGYLGGMAIGLLSLGSIVVMVYVAMAPPAGERPPSGRRGIALAISILKYSLAIAGLYLLVAHCKVNEWAIFFGLLTPVVLAIVLGMRLPAQTDKSPPED